MKKYINSCLFVLLSMAFSCTAYAVDRTVEFTQKFYMVPKGGLVGSIVTTLDETEMFEYKYRKEIVNGHSGEPFKVEFIIRHVQGNEGVAYTSNVVRHNVGNHTQSLTFQLPIGFIKPHSGHEVKKKTLTAQLVYMGVADSDKHYSKWELRYTTLCISRKVLLLSTTTISATHPDRSFDQKEAPSSDTATASAQPKPIAPVITPPKPSAPVLGVPEAPKHDALPKPSAPTGPGVPDAPNVPVAPSAPLSGIPAIPDDDPLFGSVGSQSIPVTVHVVADMPPPAYAPVRDDDDSEQKCPLNQQKMSGNIME